MEGICHIVARPVGANWRGRSRLSPCGSAIPSADGLGHRNEFLGGYDPPRQFESDFTNRPDNDTDVICGAPDDLHYELEPMLESENEMETALKCPTKVRPSSDTCSAQNFKNVTQLAKFIARKGGNEGAFGGILHYFSRKRPCVKTSKWRKPLEDIGVKFDAQDFVTDWQCAKKEI